LAVAQGSQLVGDDGKAGTAAPIQIKPLAQPPEHSCGKFGTSVEFVSTPSEAAQKAKKEEKLVFVLHVSGHFEDPRFT
jgi:hypothetical protein